MSIASWFLHFAVQCFYLQFRPQSSTGNEDVFPWPVTGVCPPPPPPLSLWAWKNSLQVSHRFFTEFRCQMKGVTVMRLPRLPPFRCVYIHFRPLPPPIPPFMITWYFVPFELTDKRWEERLTRILLFICQVRLLKDILEAWKKEVEKKPSDLTLDEAYETLKVKKDPSG